MYNDAPGDFFFSNGDPCPVDRARKAGFKVDDLLAEKEKMQKRQAFEKTLSTGATAAFDRTGVRVIAGAGKGKYRLVGADGVAITDDVSKSVASTTYKALTGQDIDLSAVGESGESAESDDDGLV